jgi:DNA polymerase-1
MCCRYLDDIDSDDDEKRAQAERQAVNTVIQGSAADLMKLAMLKIAARLSDWNKEAVNDGSTGKVPRILLQIHDELLFEIGANEADAGRLKSAVLRCADECGEEFRLTVPLKLKCRWGPSWSTLNEC